VHQLGIVGPGAITIGVVMVMGWSAPCRWAVWWSLITVPMMMGFSSGNCPMLSHYVVTPIWVLWIAALMMNDGHCGRDRGLGTLNWRGHTPRTTLAATTPVQMVMRFVRRGMAPCFPTTSIDNMRTGTRVLNLG